MIDAVAEENSSFSEQSVHFADLVIAAVRGDALARRSLDETLPGLSRYEETAALARWVTRTLAGADPAEDLTGTRDQDSVALKNYIAVRIGQATHLNQ